MDDVPLRTPEQAAKTAERHNRKLAKRFPLLAVSDQLGLGADVWTPERVMADERHFRDAMDANNRRATARGDELRSLVAQRVSAEQLAELDSYFQRTLPQADAAYWADYWWEQLRQRWPERAWEMCPNAYLHATFAKFASMCRTCGHVLTKTCT